jgi:hypothetical protein
LFHFAPVSDGFERGWANYCVVDMYKKGTPSALKNASDETWVTEEGGSSRRKSTPGDASMRRSIQDLVLSIDPNVKIEPEVEDVRSLYRPFSFWLPPPTLHTLSLHVFLRALICGHHFFCSFSWILPTSL